MRKYIIGAMFGIVLTLTSSVFADDLKSLVGKAIQGEFVVKYEGIILDKKAVVIDGSSYLPVKAIGESLDLDVAFDKNTGIAIKKKETQSEPNVTNVVYGNVSMKYYNSAIKSANDTIVELQDMINKYKMRDPVDTYTIQQWENTIVKLQVRLIDLEQKKAALTK